MKLPWLTLALLPLFACKGGDDGKQAANKVAVSEVAETKEPVLEKQTHSNGMVRFKDPGVYVDGKPVGVLRFGELPTSVKPVWIKEEGAVTFNPGDEGPKTRVVMQRRYRFSDYFKAMGVDLSKVKEMHLYGGNQYAAAVVIPGKNLALDGFLFRFGGAIWGKPLPVCPLGIGDGKCPDQIGSLALYVDKEPPKREGGYFYFDDKRVEGIPYFGEPLRGGVRVYFDGPMVATVKRNKLRAAKLEPISKTETSETYKLLDFLKTQGVDTDKIQEAWIISYERHVEKFNREQLLNLTFVANQGESGVILVGDKLTHTHAITLHSKPLTPDELPKLTEEEIEKADG